MFYTNKCQDYFLPVLSMNRKAFRTQTKADSPITEYMTDVDKILK